MSKFNRFRDNLGTFLFRVVATKPHVESIDALVELGLVTLDTVLREGRSNDNEEVSQPG